MRRTRTARRRGGFTLIELLAVVAIVALLAALGTAAFLRARSGQEVSATEGTLAKVKSGLDRKWKAVLDDANDDSTKGRIPAAVTSFAGGDPDRARVLWTYCKLKNELPTTVAEACNPVFVPADVSSARAVLVLTPKVVFLEGFRKLIPSPPARVSAISGQGDIGESAACFYWALTQSATRGEVFDTDGINQQVGELGGDVPVTFVGPTGAGSGSLVAPRVFKDNFGNPLVFLRQGYTAELNDRPFTPAKLVPNVTNRDALDPKGRLMDFSKPAVWSNAHLTRFWRALFPTNNEFQYQDAAGNTLNVPASPHAVLPATPAQSFRQLFPTYKADRYDVQTNPLAGAWNWAPAVISAGSDRALASDLGQGDDLLSFRLAREGNKGN